MKFIANSTLHVITDTLKIENYWYSGTGTLVIKSKSNQIEFIARFTIERDSFGSAHYRTSENIGFTQIRCHQELRKREGQKRCQPLSRKPMIIRDDLRRIEMRLKLRTKRVYR